MGSIGKMEVLGVSFCRCRKDSYLFFDYFWSIYLTIFILLLAIELGNYAIRVFFGVRRALLK